jgi:heme/copper-type cytochrome/quinol oxidase subunit 1
MEALVEIPDPIKSFPGISENTDQGLLQWISAVDHKMLGIMYLLVSLLFFVVGGAEALLMRIQLAQPLNHFLSAEAYNQLFTMHGTTMIFLVAMPAIFGFSVYMVPLMIGANEMAFPRLNSCGLLSSEGCCFILAFWLAARQMQAGSIMRRSTKRIIPVHQVLIIMLWVY